ncbi:hypothetical protein [Paenibacillus cineris]|uniref:Uncharacterized protein n=1 Tax=Paenibacillus cineris TaxID=237530 RepID=A0ABQ4L557_9BACL|nr:hypothetical protein [Paenibacillus cineris]GIO51749.1 hypothetical protein J21TS7_00670 [Paenibacillus cineris]
MPSITDALRARGIGSSQGISQTDLTALIDVTNAAEANNDAIKTDVVNKLNTLNPALNLTTAASWSTIRAAIGGIQYRGAQTITPGPGDISIPAGYHSGGGKVSGVSVPVANVLAGTTIAGQTGTMTNRGEVTITPGPADQSIPAGYHNGAGVVKGVVVPTSKLVEGNTVAGQAGTLKDYSRAKLGTGTTYVAAVSARGDNGGILVVEPQTGYYTTGLNATNFGSISTYDANYIPANILSGKSIFGVAGTAPGAGQYYEHGISYQSYKTTGTFYTDVITGIRKGGGAIITENQGYIMLYVSAQTGYGMLAYDQARISLVLIDDVTGTEVSTLYTQWYSYDSPGSAEWRVDSIVIDRVNERIKVRLNGATIYGTWTVFTAATNNPVSLKIKHSLSVNSNAGINGGLYTAYTLQAFVVQA